MPRFPRGIISLATSALFVIGLGCEGGKPSVESSMEEATVKGVVTFKGKPVTKGEIAFDPSNHQRKMAAAVRAPLGSDGSYSLKTLVGDNKVSFAIAETARDPNLQDLMIPRDVQSGENTFDLRCLPPLRIPDRFPPDLAPKSDPTRRPDPARKVRGATGRRARFLAASSGH